MKRLLVAAVVCMVVVSVRADQQEWSQKMAEMKATLTTLVPFIFDTAQFQDPKNFAEIDRQTEKLYKISTDLNQRKIHLSATAPDPDPGIEYMSFLLHDKISRAYNSLKANQREYAQGLLRTATASCISCHTRSNMGPQFSMAEIGQLKGLSPVDRISFYAATRQFDSALADYKKNVARAGANKISPFEFERISRVVLATAVRVKQDPSQTLQVVHLISQSPAATTEFKKTAEVWRKAVMDWKKEKPSKDNEELVTRAEALINDAQKVQKFPSDAKGDIQYMRATSLLHDYLRTNPKGARSGLALYLIGQAYDALRDLGFWSMHEMYYEACIHQIPHTAQAVDCYKKYEDSLVFGYTGSRGTTIPADVNRHLADLKALAEPPVRTK